MQEQGSGGLPLRHRRCGFASAERKEKVSYAGLSTQEKSMLEPHPRMDGLDPRIGFSLLELTQPKHFLPQW
jgi:hypothetical protein